MKTRRGFTLVEMLTVIVIILVLAGITMKLMALVTQKTGIARAAGDLERIKSALTEYYAVYGCYPPASRMDRESQHENESMRPASPPEGGSGYYDGLTTYLFPNPSLGDDPDPNSWRWNKYLDGWPNGDEILKKGYNPKSGNLIWSNSYQTINDPWNRSFIYNSSEPYQSFLLYSLGPDGTAGTADDIGNKWVE